jgi:hypothetical protein
MRFSCNTDKMVDMRISSLNLDPAAASCSPRPAGDTQTESMEALLIGAVKFCPPPAGYASRVEPGRLTAPWP